MCACTMYIDMPCVYIDDMSYIVHTHMNRSSFSFLIYLKDSNSLITRSVVSKCFRITWILASLLPKSLFNCSRFLGRKAQASPRVISQKKPKPTLISRESSLKGWKSTSKPSPKSKGRDWGTGLHSSSFNNTSLHRHRHTHTHTNEKRVSKGSQLYKQSTILIAN